MVCAFSAQIKCRLNECDAKNVMRRATKNCWKRPAGAYAISFSFSDFGWQFVCYFSLIDLFQFSIVAALWWCRFSSIFWLFCIYQFRNNVWAVYLLFCRLFFFFAIKYSFGNWLAGTQQPMMQSKVQSIKATIKT